MQQLISSIHPDTMVYAGAAGLLLGFLFLILFLYRRICWLIGKLGRKKTDYPGALASLRNLVLILLWTSIFGMLCFFGFFLRTYHAFTYEKPVAEIVVEPLAGPGTVRVTLTEFDPPSKRQFLVKGDQWMVEGDILKWESWLNFCGLENRYRLTRLRGRYARVEAEVRETPTIYALVQEESHPLWRLLYEYGHRMPLVSTAYGSAVFQIADKDRRYVISLSSAGFVARPK
jgi:hypothetical protein